MNEEELRNLLKKSPSLTPPESFYRNVMEKIERPRAPWFWGLPVKALASACVLMVIVLVTRETKKSEPTLFEMKADTEKVAAIQSESRPVPLLKSFAAIPAKESGLAGNKPQRVVDTFEEQSHLNRSISGDVGTPSAVENEQVGRRMMAVDELVLKKQAQEQEFRGTSSGISVPKQVVITTELEWRTLWRDHTSRVRPTPALPSIDFEHDMVVGVFAGTKSSAGYGVAIETIKSLSNNVVVVYRETSPPAGAMTAQMLTQPYHLRVIPKTSLPITFQKAQ